MTEITFNREAFLRFCTTEEIENYDQFAGEAPSRAYGLDNMLSQAQFGWQGKPIRVGAVSTGDNGYLVVGKLLVCFLDSEEEDDFPRWDMEPAEMADWIEDRVSVWIEECLPKALSEALS